MTTWKMEKIRRKVKMKRPRVLVTNRLSGQPAKTTGLWEIQPIDTRKKGKRWSTRKRVRPLNKMERDS